MTTCYIVKIMDDDKFQYSAELVEKMCDAINADWESITFYEDDSNECFVKVMGHLPRF